MQSSTYLYNKTFKSGIIFLRLRTQISGILLLFCYQSFCDPENLNMKKEYKQKIIRLISYLRNAEIKYYSNELDIKAPNDTEYKRWSCHSGLKLLCKLCRTSPPPAMGAQFTVFWACRPCGPARWLALLLTKAGGVETNPGPTTFNKKIWICDICHKQIHVRNQISIKCNRIEHWVHLRCAGIRQAQYTDTWT